MLEFKRVSVSVGKTPILKDISVQFKKGEITTVIGPNGCGKTTLLQTLNAMSHVTSGGIFLDGEDYLKLKPRERARRLSFMPQLRENAPCITVKGLVEHGRFPYMGFSRKMSTEDTEAVENAMTYVNIKDCAKDYVNELSGGQQQRAYLAMQLAQSCEYIVMDEPMNYLDFPGQREMYELVWRLKSEGRTVILVLHDLNQALRISDRLVIMQNRRLEGSFTPEECLENGIIDRVFNCRVSTVSIEGKTQYMFL